MTHKYVGLLFAPCLLACTTLASANAADLDLKGPDSKGPDSKDPGAKDFDTNNPGAVFISDTPVYPEGGEHALEQQAIKDSPAWDRWAISFDNDILVPGSRDRDYTYGINLLLSGEGARESWYSPYRGHTWLDRGLGIDNNATGDNTAYAIDTVNLEIGVVAFTPEDTNERTAIEDDRPYSSLLYISSLRQQVNEESDTAWNSSLTLGVLGLPLVGGVQNKIHDVLGGDRANGWNNQISDGGELTARYSVARQRYLRLNLDNVEVKTALQGSVGYLSEVSWSVNLRAGHVVTPWWSFNPQLASYGQQSTELVFSSQQESYFWAGFALKARAYNAFLQGQFRDSAVSYSSGELNHLLLEAWAGYTLALNGGYRISYVVRGHTSEVKQGTGDRDLLWGGITVSKAF